MSKAQEERKIRLLKFGATWCGPCQAMAKAKTLEKLSAAHPDIELKLYDLPAEEESEEEDDEESKSEPTDEEAEAIELADEYKIEAMPTFIFLDADDDDERELFRIEGATDLKGLEKAFKKAIAKRESNDKEEAD